MIQRRWVKGTSPAKTRKLLEMLCKETERRRKVGEEMKKELKGPASGAKEHRVNFMQVVGPDIPLCWIPVDDVKAVVMLLAVHQPKSESLEIVKAQFEATIGHLNKYIDEAIERNNRSALGMVTTWTHDDKKEKR
jgi:hypothetical protein